MLIEVLINLEVESRMTALKCKKGGEREIEEGGKQPRQGRYPVGPAITHKIYMDAQIFWGILDPTRILLWTLRDGDLSQQNLLPSHPSLMINVCFIKENL